jgi:hypothetical protein
MPAARRRLPLTACLALLLPACAPGDDAAAPAEVGGLSLALLSETDKYDGRFTPRPPRLTVRITNAGPKALEVAGVEALKGHEHYPNGDLRWARGISFALRFADGTTVEVPYRYPHGLPDAGGLDFASLRYGPLEVPAGRSKECKVDLADDVMVPAARELFKRCRSFCLTVVVPKSGLRSNTLFFNGEFPLPANYDPVAEARAFRKEDERREAAKAQKEAARRRAEEEEFKRSLKEQGLPVPP